MKKLSVLSRLTFLILISGLIFSCGKKKDTVNPSTGGSSAAVSYTLDGTSYSATTNVTVTSSEINDDNYNPPVNSTGSYLFASDQSSYNGVSLYSFYTIQANLVGTGDTLVVGMIYGGVSQLKAGTYSIAAAGTSLAGFSPLYSRTTDSDFDSDNATATGTVVISAIDYTNKTVSGTYSFTLTDNSSGKAVTRTVTNGKFSGPLQVFTEGN